MKKKLCGPRHGGDLSRASKAELAASVAIMEKSIRDLYAQVRELTAKQTVLEDDLSRNLYPTDKDRQWNGGRGCPHCGATIGPWFRLVYRESDNRWSYSWIHGCQVLNRPPTDQEKLAQQCTDLQQKLRLLEGEMTSIGRRVTDLKDLAVRLEVTKPEASQ